MSTSPVRLEQRDGLAILTLTNPPLNLVTLALRQALDDALEQALEQALEIYRTHGLRALIVTGEGEKAFCCGSDVSEFPPLMAPGKVVPGKLGPENATFNKLAAFPAPTIAAINGLAFGGGLEMACCCDLIVADDVARLCLPEVKLGLIPGSGGPVRLIRRIGEARARDMMLLADPVDAHTALDWGLINRIAPKGEALAGALALAVRLEGAPLKPCICATRRSNWLSIGTTMTPSPIHWGSVTLPSAAKTPGKDCAHLWRRRHHALHAGDTLSSRKTEKPGKLYFLPPEKQKKHNNNYISYR